MENARLVGPARLLATLLLAAGVVAFAGCSIPETSFEASPDSGIDAPADHQLELDPADVTIGEGSTRTITVRAVPTPELHTEILLTAGTGLALGAPSVTLGPGQPSTTVEVTALDDADAQDVATTITANAAGHDAASTRVTVDDDEVLEIVVDFDELTIRENGLGGLGVRLSAQPAGDVTVAVASSDPSVATVSDGTLSFGVDDWNLPQTIDVVGVRDADVIDETIAVSLTSAPLAPRNVTVHVTDIDHQGILAEQAAVEVHEGQPGGTTLRLYLAQQPAGDVIVDIAPQDARLHVSETSVTFGPGNFNMPRSITVTADGDDNVTGFASSLRMTAVGLPDPLSVGVTAIDDDRQEILVAAASPFRVTEQAAATFTARLRFRPAADTLVGVAPVDGTVATAMPGSLTFTTGGAGAWSQPQTITVSGLADDDTTPETTKIRLQAPSVPTYDLDTTIVDDDTLALVVVGAPAQVQEGSSASFTVALAFQPPTPIEVTVMSSDAASITATPPALNFGLGDWSTPQTVMLGAPIDADLVSEQVNVTLASPGNLVARVLPVGVAEQTVLGITTTVATVTVAEGVGAATVGVRLSTAPLGPVTLSVASSSTQVAATAADLTFGPGDWMTPKPMVITALADDDVVNGSATVTISGPGLADRTVAVTTSDSDVVELRPSTGAVAVTEGQTATFTVRLGHKPPAGVTVNLASLAGAVATVVPPSIDFAPQSWNAPVTVTVTGTSDNDLAAASTTVRLTAAGLVPADVAVNVTDDDVQALVLAGAPATMTEGPVQAMFTVRLAYQPAADVTVNLSSGNPAAVTVTPTSMTFGVGNWSMAKAATLTAPVDDDLLPGAATITVAAPGNALARTFDVAVTDPDVLAIVNLTGNVAITEGAAGAPISVRLNKQPGGPVVVSASSNLPLAAVGPPSRTFDPMTWQQAQTFTITAPVDDDTAGGGATITLHAAQVQTDVTLTATVTDPDVQTILHAAPNPLAVVEGTTVGFNIRLKHRPAADVTINVASLAGAVATVSPGSLTFNSSNWSFERPVMVTGAPDVNMVDATTAVRLSAAGLATVDVPVAVDDDDVQVIDTSVGTVLVNEGATATVNVTLRYQPAGPTTVTVASSNNGKLTVSGNLSFGIANYNVAQPVTLTAVADADTLDETAVVTLGNFDAPLPATVQVTVRDITMITDVGYSSYFGTAASWSAGTAVAFPITIASAGNLGSFGVITGAAGSEAKMALYGNSGGVPGALIASIDNPTVLGAGIVLLDVADVPLASGSYWLALRVNPAASIGTSTTSTGNRCTKSMPTFTNAWPAAWGTTSCNTGALLNVFARTYRN